MEKVRQNLETTIKEHERTLSYYIDKKDSQLRDVAFSQQRINDQLKLIEDFTKALEILKH